MRTRTGLGLAALASCAALLAAVTVGRDGDGNVASSLFKPPNGPYVALGDSYTAGPKIPDQTGKPAGCDRSDRNYPALVSDGLGLAAADFRDVSCSGATIGDLLAPQSTDRGVNPAQLSAVSSATRLVTVGIGGNDIDFSSLITSCVKAGVRYQLENRIGDRQADDALCRARHVSAGTDEVEAKIKAAGGRLSGVLSDIERRAPKARVYVIGYPAILPAKGTDCAGRMGLAPGDVTFLRQKEQQLNAMLRDKAESAGAGYVDTYTPSAGRDACADRDVRWVEPLMPAVPAAPVHPNERGMAQAVLRTVRVSG
ncbi:SGNH/GDSL hydrolase family protein [Streptomyces sporangiiformans]|uniref:SGNH/GDSL hydrolase family protein n=1 Tax=Streptomyces sporangiiformans TaxID=2315329 RepID=A0A505DPZ5_9ACTN|nr:SGNH/GDSL hydrolase family protein [Streptomyces sporangiiformans]TPQ23319.1 SGNH/GDSL hydrolase family protein [Streptomyces sporangiiformans]